MKAKLIPEWRIACPVCDKVDHVVGHLYGRPGTRFGPWACEHCGVWYRGVVDAPGEVEVELTGEPKALDTYTVLVLPPQDEPLFLVLNTKAYRGSIDPAGDQYFYEEHTCPTNWMRDVEEIMIGDDHDPHGLFRYLGAVERGDPAGDTSCDSKIDQPGVRALIDGYEPE